VVADIEAGECFTESNIRSIRPGFGLPPKHLKSVLGKTASRALKRGEPLAADMIRDDTGNVDSSRRSNQS
jgi:N-acetylneuraminate synthase